MGTEMTLEEQNQVLLNLLRRLLGKISNVAPVLERAAVDPDKWSTESSLDLMKMEQLLDAWDEASAFLGEYDLAKMQERPDTDIIRRFKIMTRQYDLHRGR